MVKLIFFIIVIGFSVIQSIMKAANEKAEAKQRQAQLGPPGGRKRVQSEIESFLQEVTGKAAPAGNNLENDIKVQRSRQQRENRRQEEATRKRDQQVKRKLSRQQPKAAPAGKSRSRKPNERSIGSKVSEHVNSYIGKHVNDYLDHDVNEYVEDTIESPVQNYMGGRGSTKRTTTTGRKKNRAAADVAALLRDPRGVRNAILVNEILSRPRSMRK